MTELGLTKALRDDTISEEDALIAFDSQSFNAIRPASIGVERTVVHPINRTTASGTVQLEVQPFLTAGMYATEEEIQIANEYEKQYPELQIRFRKMMEEATKGRPEFPGWKCKMLPNPLNAVEIEVSFGR